MHIIMNSSINLVDELSIIFLWIGIWGMFDMFLNVPELKKHRYYIYLLLILIALYFKM